MPPQDDPAPQSQSASSAEVVTASNHKLSQELFSTEDWWAIWVGGILLTACFLAVYSTRTTPIAEVPESSEVVTEDTVTETESKPETKPAYSNPLKPWITKPGTWGLAPVAKSQEAGEEKVVPNSTEQFGNPLEAFRKGEHSLLPGILTVFAISALLFALGIQCMSRNAVAFLKGYWFVFLLATFSYVLASQAVVNHYNLEYALWALASGLLISNTIRTPQFVKPALRTEFYIKTGLVLLGAEVLFSRLLALSVPGIYIAWVVTPIVLISTYIFGQKVLKIQSRSLNMVISADMSVCGVSAAIATAASCKAKKSELSFAIGLSLTFTVLMMIVLPILIKLLGLNPVVGGAWIGGTVDSTGAVAVAGGLLGDVALDVATTIKMIQNILIGVVAFGVAVYWVTCVERGEGSVRPDIWEVWRRFPKFVLGFVLASVVFSWMYANWANGPELVNSVVKGASGTLRGWFFCLAFVSIGLETNFRELTQFLKGGKPLMLYVVGQSLNLVLTLLMAWLMFEVIYPETTQELLKLGK